MLSTTVFSIFVSLTIVSLSFGEFCTVEEVVSIMFLTAATDICDSLAILVTAADDRLSIFCAKECKTFCTCCCVVLVVCAICIVVLVSCAMVFMICWIEDVVNCVVGVVACSPITSTAGLDPTIVAVLVSTAVERTTFACSTSIPIF